MEKILASVVIDRPAEAVWKFTTDWSNNPKWDKNCVETKQTSAGPIGVGSTGQYRRSSFPKINDWQVVEYEPNRKFSFKFASGPMKGTVVAMTLETVEGKTRLTETDDYKIGGIYRLALPFMGGQSRAKREAEGRIGGIKRVLESESKP
jgi:uncharacterized protein YndB with AHSA1/START domain